MSYAYDESLKSITLEADASIAVRTGVPGMPGSLDPNGGKQFYLVRITGVHQAGLVSTAGTDAVGVLQNKPQNLGEAATVGIFGVSLVVAGGVLAAGDSVAAKVDGTAVKANGTTDINLGVVIGGANSGQLATVLLRMN
jgi:hypothetical protein